MSKANSYFWYPNSTDTQKCFDYSLKDSENLDYTWTGTHGKAAGAAYFLAAFRYLRSEGIQCSKVRAIGWSVGSQMLSAAINYFPDLGADVPRIIDGTLFAGGSQFCYIYDGYGAPPRAFGHCKDTSIHRGCYPSNATEMSYMPKCGGTRLLKDHAPMLLIQSQSDDSANTEASWKVLL